MKMKNKTMEINEFDKRHQLIHEWEDDLRKEITTICCELISNNKNDNLHIDISYLNSHTELQRLYFANELGTEIVLDTTQFILELEDLEFDQLYHLYTELCDLL